ncbi:MAG TPA: HAMP domain-containing sensor histidine kinase [Chloroflexota bacterium]|nr:HAMP domain-containing sensor histidine kinase [Chloroflexota bacterium]
MPIRWRVALFGAGLVTLAMLGFSGLVYALASLGAAEQRDRELTSRSEQAALAVQQVGDPASLATRPALLPLDASDTIETYVLVDGVPRVDDLLTVPDPVLREADQRGSALTTIDRGAPTAMRVSVRPWARSDVGVTGYVVAARAANSVQANLAGLRGFLVLSGVAILITALLASWLAAGRALTPLDTVARLMEEIGLTRDLGRRLPPTRTHDEVGRLTVAFNRMLQQLQETNQQLAGALESQRRFVADSSHELRTPLTTVRNNAGLLLHRSDLAEEDRQAALQDIASESERMGRLIGDLLTLARADAGQPVQHQPLDLASLVDDVARQARRTYPTRTLSTWTEQAVVNGDAEALTRLLWILLNNAARYTPEGGQIDLHLTCRGDVHELLVSDNGVGIAASDLERIFDRFFRSDAARAGEGAGLGLAIARTIAEQHHGSIEARNRIGGGAVFSVRLPNCDAAMTPA